MMMPRTFHGRSGGGLSMGLEIVDDGDIGRETDLDDLEACLNVARSAPRIATTEAEFWAAACFAVGGRHGVIHPMPAAFQ